MNDVTESRFTGLIRRVLKKINRNAERLHTMAELLDVAPNSITIHDFEGNLLYVNRKTLELHGYNEKNEFLALNVHQLDVPESEALIAERMNLIEEKGEASFEVRHFRKDGSVFPLLVYAKKTRWHGQPALMSIATDISEHKKAETALRMSEDRFRLLFENAPIPYQSLDEQGNFIEVNKAFLQVLGYQREELIGRNFGDFTHPDYAIYFKENFPIFKSIGEILGVEFEMLKKDGSTILVYFNGKIQRDSAGRFQRTHCVFHDITEQRKTEDALRENEQKYRSLLEGLPDIVMRFDQDGRHLFVSGNISRVIDTPPEGIIGRTHRELGFSEDFCRFWEKTLQKVFNSGVPYETETSLESKHGPMIFNWRLQPEFNLQGDVTSVLSIARDITQYRQVERNYHMLFHEMLSGFALHEIILNPQGKPVDYRYLAVNPAFEKMTGLKAEEVIGKTVMEVLPETEHYWIETFGQVAITGSPATFENYTAELQKFFHVSSFSPAPNQFACLIRDITEQKEMEVRIRQKEKMESIGRLAGGIAHDFNNMLSVILGHVQVMLEDTGSDMSTRQAFESIEQAAQRSAELTSQLLGFARKQIVSPKTIDLNRSVESMIRMLRRIVGENIDLNWIPGIDLWTVKLDPVQLDQILMNLTANARSAISGKGEIIITTANASLDQHYMDEHPELPGFVPGEYVMLALSDNGCGMDREMQKQIFDPFFTTREVGQGTGMGLATVYGIIKQNNGFIYVDSEPGQGTVFTVYFPRQTKPDTSPEETAPPVTVPSVWETVLLVEDAPEVLEMCRMMLTKLGYKVLPAGTPAEALRLAEEYKGDIQLMICDVIMPEMNGAELTKQLTPLRPDIKCLFMSGYTADIIASQGVLEEGMNFIEKPFTKKALETKIREIFNQE